MATKKPTSVSNKKTPGTALTIWEEEMAQAVIAQGKSETVTGSFKSISLHSGILSVDGNAVEDNELNVIILASTHENQYYASDFDPNTPTTPICYAFGNDDDALVPHTEATDKQSEQCKGCPHNEWGSAEKGKGKACKNVRRMLLVTEDALESAKDLAEAEARMLKLPVMSVKNYANYVKTVLEDDLKRPTWAVVTKIKTVPDAKSLFRVKFEFQNVVEFDQELYDAMKKKVKEAESNIGNAYPVFEEDDKPAKPLKGKRTVVPIKVAGKVKPAPVATAKRGKY